MNIILPANDFLDDGCEHLTEMFVLFDEEDVDDKDVEADIGKVRSPSRRIFVRLGNTIWPKIPLLDFLVKLYFCFNKTRFHAISGKSLFKKHQLRFPFHRAKLPLHQYGNLRVALGQDWLINRSAVQNYGRWGPKRAVEAPARILIKFMDKLF